MYSTFSSKQFNPSHPPPLYEGIHLPDLHLKHPLHRYLSSHALSRRPTFLRVESHVLRNTGTDSEKENMWHPISMGTIQTPTPPTPQTSIFTSLDKTLGVGECRASHGRAAEHCRCVGFEVSLLEHSENIWKVEPLRRVVRELSIPQTRTVHKRCRHELEFHLTNVGWTLRRAWKVDL